MRLAGGGADSTCPPDGRDPRRLSFGGRVQARSRDRQRPRVGRLVVTDDRLRRLERAWQSTGTTRDEQAYLAARLRAGVARLVYLDPDGTFAPWLGVVIRHPTGIVYGQQCAGVRTEQRLVEGYFIPLGGASFDFSEDPIDVSQLSAVFHDPDGSCPAPTGDDLSPTALTRLGKAIRRIPCWWTPDLGDGDVRASIDLDLSRTTEMAEAWIPVTTPHGAGILLTPNCD